MASIRKLLDWERGPFIRSAYLKRIVNGEPPRFAVIVANDDATYTVTDRETKTVIMSGSAEPVADALDREGWRLDLRHL